MKSRRHRASRSGTLTVAFLCATLASLALGASPSSAVVHYTHPFITSFDGAGSSSGALEQANRLAFDQHTHTLYALDRAHGGILDKFDANGVPQQFSGLAPGTTTVPYSCDYGGPDVAVDQSGTATEGRIYVLSDCGGLLHAFEPNGVEVGGNFPLYYPGWNYTCGVGVDPTGHVWVKDFGAAMKQFNPDGTFTGKEFQSTDYICHFAIDQSAAPSPSRGSFYMTHAGDGIPETNKFDAEGNFLGYLKTDWWFPNAVAVDPITRHVYIDDGDHFSEFDENGVQVGTSGRTSVGHGFPNPRCTGSAGIAVDASTENVYLSDCGKIDVFGPGETEVYPTVVSDPPHTEAHSAILYGHVDPDGGGDTVDCHFEWGRKVDQFENKFNYEYSAPCLPNAAIHNSDGNTPVSAEIGNLIEGDEYHYRLVSSNANGPEFGVDREFIARGPPIIEEVLVSKVNTDGATLSANIDPRGGPTTFHVEWGTDTSYGKSIPVPDGDVATIGAEGPDPTHTHEQSVILTHLASDAQYHFRFVATNPISTVYSDDVSFTTFSLNEDTVDPCVNSQERKQTGTALLFDCRAYELVSAGDTGGYDVQSDLVPGQETLSAFPGAKDKVVYSMHDGAIPNVGGHPTNLGLDPYVATRGRDSWTTTYLGVPANDQFSLAPFSSVPTGGSSDLGTLAFGGEKGCSPCFADGSTGIPVRLPNGELVQGMAASPLVPSPGPGTEPDGHVAKKVSSDGSHLVFGSTSRFAPGGNDGTGDVSIYDRNLVTGDTRTVSFAPDGSPLACLQGVGSCHSPGNGDGIGELDISADGSRILLGERVSKDADGNAYWRLYMNIGDAAHTVALTAGASSGVLFDGMTSDGTKVYFATADKLIPAEDTDTSVDIYEAAVDGGGTVQLSLISDGQGIAGNDESCNPPGEWNIVSGPPKCNAVGFAGGAGVASGDGTIYFLSPSLLDGPSNGTQDQPNLYRAQPGAAPRFVATIDSSITKPPPPPPIHEVVNSNFAGGGFGNAEEVAVDQSNGDVYVVDTGQGMVLRYAADGQPHNFTAGPSAGTNRIEGFGFDSPSATQVAVDSSGGALDGTIYVANYGGVNIYGTDGSVLGALSGSGTSTGYFSEACGVAVDPTNGDVYVGDRWNADVWRYSPSSPSGGLDDSDYTVTGTLTQGLNPCNVAVDSIGNVYASGASEGPLYAYKAADFKAGPPHASPPRLVSAVSTGVGVDTQSNEVYVVQTNKVAVFEADGDPVTIFGATFMPASRGVAVNAATGHVYVTSKGLKVVEFGSEPAPWAPIDNPAVVHGTTQNDLHTFGDFQVSPDGQFAAFASTQPLTGYQNRNHYEIFRYAAAGGGAIDCASCPSTEVGASADVTLLKNGLDLTDDGRLFFTTPEKLVVRDTNSVPDAYEWKDGENELVSSGLSQFDSGMLTVSADGGDAFFFTRQVLVSQDGNGAVLKVYDARTGGGFLVPASSLPCQASDECHGPGSEAAPPPDIGTYKGIGGNVEGSPAKPLKPHKKKHHKHHRHPHKGKGDRRHG